MKKILLLTAAIVAISLSCRKGPNDPFFSIRSRESRLVGVWNMSSLYVDSAITISSTLKVESKSFITSFPVDSGVKKYDDGNGNVRDSIYTEVLVINDDGTYSDTIKCHKIASATKKLRVIANQWYWTNDKHKKDGVVLVGYGTFKLDKLSWKEIDLTYNKTNFNYSSYISSTLKNGTNINVTKTLKFNRN